MECVISRKEIIENGRDSSVLPSYCDNTLIPNFWNDKVIDGVKRSIIHPEIKQLIVWSGFIEKTLRIDRED